MGSSKTKTISERIQSGRPSCFQAKQQNKPVVSNKHTTVIPITLWYKSHGLRPSSARRSLLLTLFLHPNDSKGLHRAQGTHFLSYSNTGPAQSSYSFAASLSARSPPPSFHTTETPREWLPSSDCDISRRTAGLAPAAPDYITHSLRSHLNSNASL